MEQKNESWLADPNPVAGKEAEKTEQTDPFEKQGVWERIRHLGLEPTAMRSLTLVATVVMMALVVWVMSNYYVSVEGQSAVELRAVAATQSAPVSAELFLAQAVEPIVESDAIRRNVNPDTVLPMRARTEIISYTVQPGDNLFSIAERFNLQPETVLWSNRYTLGDDPHFIYPGQQLLISPVDGTLHRWSAGEGLNGVAEYYKVTPDVIVNFSRESPVGGHHRRLCLPRISPLVPCWWCLAARENLPTGALRELPAKSLPPLSTWDPEPAQEVTMGWSERSISVGLWRTTT